MRGPVSVLPRPLGRAGARAPLWPRARQNCGRRRDGARERLSARGSASRISASTSTLAYSCSTMYSATRLRTVGFSSIWLLASSSCRCSTPVGRPRSRESPRTPATRRARPARSRAGVYAASHPSCRGSRTRKLRGKGAHGCSTGAGAHAIDAHGHARTDRAPMPLPPRPQARQNCQRARALAGAGYSLPAGSGRSSSAAEGRRGALASQTQQAASLAFEIPLAIPAHMADPAMAANVTPHRLPARPMRLARTTRLSFMRISLARTPLDVTPAKDDEFRHASRWEARPAVAPAARQEHSSGQGRPKRIVDRAALAMAELRIRLSKR